MPIGSDVLPSFCFQIVQVLQFVAECEAIELPVQLARNIADMSKHSTVRHAIRALEATRQSK